MPGTLAPRADVPPRPSPFEFAGTPLLQPAVSTHKRNRIIIHFLQPAASTQQILHYNSLSSTCRILTKILHSNYKHCLQAKKKKGLVSEITLMNVNLA